MSLGEWRWEAYDSTGHKAGCGRVDPQRVWWATTAQEVADFGLAQIMVHVAPEYGRRRGWSVKAWRDDESWVVAWAWAAEWLSTLEQGAVRRLSTR
jgi:hypothetical protein